MTKMIEGQAATPEEAESKLRAFGATLKSVYECEACGLLLRVSPWPFLHLVEVAGYPAQLFKYSTHEDHLRFESISPVRHLT